MPKYIVRSGKSKKSYNAETPRDALVMFLKDKSIKTAGGVANVSKVKVKCERLQSLWFSTEQVLRDEGLLETATTMEELSSPSEKSD